MKHLQMKAHNKSGILITFCGLDGCGKTTILRRLAAELGEGDPDRVFLTKQPTDAVRQSAIFRTYMDCPDHEGYEYRSLSLLAAGDRLQHTSKVILPRLEQGQIVLSDRYFYSCLANLRARGYSGDEWIYEIARYVPRPDLAFFFDVPVVTAISRVRKRPAERDRYIDEELQYALRREYRNICGECGGILVPTDIREEESYRMVRDATWRLLEMRNGSKR